MSVQELESALSKSFHREHCVLTGRGAAAIYIALKALGRSSGKVLLPTICCTSPASVVLYAGLQPVFCDISLSNFTMDPGSVERILDRHPDVVAIIAVHIFGHPAPMEELERVASRRGIAIIEDAAQAWGTSTGIKPAGCHGKMSVVSFGHTKLLDNGWGGAVLTDDIDVAAELREQERALPDCPVDIDQLYAEYKKVYYTLFRLAAEDPGLDELFKPLPKIYRRMHLFRLPDARVASILDSLKSVDEFIEARRAKADYYRRNLLHPGIRHPAWDPGIVPWRYTFLLESASQRRVTEKLRARGIDVSNWYPPLHRWYEHETAGWMTYPVADFFSDRVINLWVAPAYPGEEMEKACRTLLQILDEEK